MAGKTTDMSKIKQVLQLHEQGRSNRQISKDLSINKETVNNYVNQYKDDPKKLSELLALEDPEMDARFHNGTPAYTDSRHDTFLSLLPYFRQELGRKHVTRYLIWQEYISKHPDGYRKSQFFFHLAQNLIASEPSTVFTGTYVPGEKLFVDFAGHTLEYVDTETGEFIKVQVFVACLPFTDYAFAICVPSQKVEDFLYAISACLSAIGGVPKILVVDNLKSAVIKADRYEPTLNKALEDMGNHYHFVTIPCQPHSPKQKALVEDQVRLVYRRVYARLRDRTFYSLEELNQAVSEKMLEHNQTRMQQRPYSRQEHFYAAEKQTLAPLPAEPYEMKFYSDLQVQQNGFIYLGRDKHYYSVPYILIGKTARVIYTRTLVKIFVDGTQVATHPRIHGFGYTKLDNHLASNSKAVLDRSPAYYQQKAGKSSPALQTLITDMFDDALRRSVPPEFRYKTCDLMLHLQRVTPGAVFEQACLLAIENHSYNGKFLQSVIANISEAMKEQEGFPKDNPTPTNHENMRGTGYYK